MHTQCIQSIHMLLPLLELQSAVAQLPNLWLFWFYTYVGTRIYNSARLHLNACAPVDIRAHYTCVQMETSGRHQAETGLRVPRDGAALQGSRQPAHQTLQPSVSSRCTTVSRLGDAVRFNADLCIEALQEERQIHYIVCHKWQMHYWCSRNSLC